ncbi:MlaE family lipid ABC transporter permease subunit [Pontixanthobacter sp.]|uniref:ABC transporter permease n=1 Tax=Pontixanthobacter sp. TaxID=2792078 RepID=UPI003C7D2345
MDEGPQFSLEDDGAGGNRLVLSGRYLVSTLGRTNQQLRAIDAPVSAVDLAGVTAIDTVGAWVASTLAQRHGAEITGAKERSLRLLEAVKIRESSGSVAPDRLPVWQRVPDHVGAMMRDLLRGMAGVVGFLGQIILAIGSVIRHPSRFRGRALVRQMELVGVSALPIVGLMSFLIGIVIAQQGAVQLAQFGAETLTVNLVGRITLRELGVLMTAIMVAGRSGSAFAAQIGTMKLTEEVDAMRTIGISPVEALVLPRILASVLMMPLLGAYAAVVAIIGGAVIGEVALGIPFLNFLERIKDVVPIHDLWVGMIKAPVFGLIIGLAGCYQGMQVEGDSEQVGKRTTQAVVSAIFMVIVIDAFFAVFFTEIGWS